MSGDDLARLLYKAFKSGHEQEDEKGAARAAQSAVCKLEIKVHPSTSHTAWLVTVACPVKPEGSSWIEARSGTDA